MYYLLRSKCDRYNDLGPTLKKHNVSNMHTHIFIAPVLKEHKIKRLLISHNINENSFVFNRKNPTPLILHYVYANSCSFVCV